MFWQYLILINTAFFATILGLIDFKTHLLPNKWIVILIATNSFLMIFSDNFTLIRYINTLLNSFLIFAFYLLIFFLSKKTFGLGDVKYSFALSMPIIYFFDIWNAISMHLWAFLLGGFFSIYLIFFKSIKLNHAIAFGPFMSLAFLLFLVLNF